MRGALGGASGRPKRLRVWAFEPETTVDGLRRQWGQLRAMANSLRRPGAGSLDPRAFSLKAQADLHLQQVAMIIAAGDVPKAQIAIAFAHGYVAALDDRRRSMKTEDATAAKQRKANELLDRVKTAAEPLRVRRLSKENVAARIAEGLKLSPDRVSKLLSEAYPGAAWKAKVPADRIDTA